MAALPFVAAPGLSARPIRSTATSRAPGHSVPAATQRREAHRKNGFVAAAPLLLAGAAAKKCTRRATAREPQVLPFVEPSSGREVVLIASVHFNPRSVQKATEVTRKLAEKKELGAVVLETCKTRWRRVEETQKPGSPLRSILDNEMQLSASERYCPDSNHMLEHVVPSPSLQDFQQFVRHPDTALSRRCDICKLLSMEVPLRRQFGLPCALRFFSVLLVLGLTLRQDEDIESLTADQNALEHRKGRKQHEARRLVEANCKHPPQMASDKEQEAIRSECGSCAAPDLGCMANCTFNVRVQHFKSGLEEIANMENSTSLEECLVQIELPIQTESGETKEVRQFRSSVLKACLKEKVHAEFEGVMEEEICDGAAAEIAEERSIDVVLGDQRIEDLTRDITTAGRAAIDDMLSPLEGWQRTGAALVSGMANLANLRKRKAEASAGSEEALGLADFADPELIFGFVVAVPRYVLSTALKAPTLLAGVLAFYLACAVLPSGILGDLIMIAAEAVLFRVILQVLLRDRDLILAENIKKVCQKKDSGSVVAVLGAAHCNGVRRLLLEGLPEKQLSDDVKDTEEESGIFWSLVEIVIKFKHFKPTSGTPKRAVMAEYSPVGLAIIAVIMACVVLLNGYFWKRFVDAEEVRQHLQDGTCEIVSPSHYSSGWKAGWEFPIIGPSWTDVPCSLKLKVKGDEGIVGKTSLHFTYWQGIVWDYVQDSCSKLIPTKADKPFDCAYLLGEHGGLSRAYVGNVRDLPRLPLLFLMKACGLSALTLGPFLLICIGTARGASRAREIVPEGENTAYAPLDSGEGGG
ncbi:hypothetical protein AK812_SmicGene37163 [Symbiodinium microadriaticum]|uniref:TraB domain-containing protein n=1 Tax=Symbiodinium microadriaticum TaxID=2951 RepID=A0A1Q9CH09_SYMMI|nr:hypothetical protein AK812_SmicGene37163 [Symbiodinium microadriaticum]